MPCVDADISCTYCCLVLFSILFTGSPSSLVHPNLTVTPEVLYATVNTSARINCSLNAPNIDDKPFWRIHTTESSQDSEDVKYRFGTHTYPGNTVELTIVEVKRGDALAICAWKDHSATAIVPIRVLEPGEARPTPNTYGKIFMILENAQIRALKHWSTVVSGLF